MGFLRRLQRNKNTLAFNFFFLLFFFFIIMTFSLPSPLTTTTFSALRIQVNGIMRKWTSSLTSLSELLLQPVDSLARTKLTHLMFLISR